MDNQRSWGLDAQKEGSPPIHHCRWGDSFGGDPDARMLATFRKSSNPSISVVTLANMVIKAFLIYIFLCQLSLNTEAAVVYLFNYCEPNTTTYVNSSTYQRNLNSLLSSLRSNSTRQTGFYNLTVGTNPPNIVYGLFLCRGDVTKATCQECVSDAAGRLLQLCPNRKIALITYDECTLCNASFFSEWQSDPQV
ncbi:hypothetical protein COLO4_15181 [Corchorus olitorius]|uniref:Gnk2-homologous domain-containing protein n=1 Tax=Corchorus olitorius TaxID=93759 RepID=A0A1R3JP68_9ROSI|nr:hypothetical protein COLO4_15181 [Corchorus olitorius]